MEDEEIGLGFALDLDCIDKIRIGLLGDCGVGKSTLSCRLTSQPGSTLYMPTVGCALHILAVTLPRGGEFFVELYDIGGNPRFSASRSVFYEGLDGFIFLWDTSSEATYHSIDQWLEEVLQSRQQTIPVEMQHDDDLTTGRLGGWRSRTNSSERSNRSSYNISSPSAATSALVTESSTPMVPGFGRGQGVSVGSTRARTLSISPQHQLSSTSLSSAPPSPGPYGGTGPGACGGSSSSAHSGGDKASVGAVSNGPHAPSVMPASVSPAYFGMQAPGGKTTRRRSASADGQAQPLHFAGAFTPNRRRGEGDKTIDDLHENGDGGLQKLGGTSAGSGVSSMESSSPRDEGELPLIIVGNKIDRLSRRDMLELQSACHNHILISAKAAQDFDFKPFESFFIDVYERRRGSTPYPESLSTPKIRGKRKGNLLRRPMHISLRYLLALLFLAFFLFQEVNCTQDLTALRERLTRERKEVQNLYKQVKQLKAANKHAEAEAVQAQIRARREALNAEHIEMGKARLGADVFNSKYGPIEGENEGKGYRKRAHPLAQGAPGSSRLEREASMAERHRVMTRDRCDEMRSRISKFSFISAEERQALEADVEAYAALENQLTDRRLADSVEFENVKDLDENDRAAFLNKVRGEHEIKRAETQELIDRVKELRESIESRIRHFGAMAPSIGVTTANAMKNAAGAEL